MDAGPRIAIDAMGGDSGPAAMIAGAARARARDDPSLQFLFHGDERCVRAELEQHHNLRDGVEIVHSPEAIGASEKPSQAIRRARTTSMGMAINAVKEGNADAALSAGNTGALMAMAKLALRTMPGIDRPALAALLPTLGEQRRASCSTSAPTPSATRRTWCSSRSWARPMRGPCSASTSRASSCSTSAPKS